MKNLVNIFDESIPQHCAFCKGTVYSGREIAGSTHPLDPAWHDDGDFGCNENPTNTDEGVGDHVVLNYDVIIALRKQNLIGLINSTLKNHDTFRGLSKEEVTQEILNDFSNHPEWILPEIYSASQVA